MSANQTHAKHNESVCNYLSRKPQFGDWIITTAFYSALHFVQSKIFPFKRKGEKITYRSFENYYAANRHILKYPSKHQVTLDLVHEFIPSVSANYQSLLELSKTARYHQYNYPREISSSAKEDLKQIKEVCIPKVTTPTKKK